MTRLLIGCDLGKQSTAETVRSALESWGAVRLIRSLWLLSTRLDGRYVSSALQDIVDEGDFFAVLDLAEGAGWSVSGASKAASEWLRQHLGEDPQQA